MDKKKPMKGRLEFGSQLQGISHCAEKSHSGSEAAVHNAPAVRKQSTRNASSQFIFLFLFSLGLQIMGNVHPQSG